MATALFAFLHILVLVYWLGGDLGAFYSSRILTRPGVSVEQRLLAAKIIGDVDMAPRCALIMAGPTGLLLAISKGWLTVPMVWAYVAFGVALLWLALVWFLHLAHVRPPGSLRALDLVLRWALFLGLIGVGLTGLVKPDFLPLFLALKCLLLAVAVLVGLAIRGVLRPLGDSLARLTDDTDSSAEATLAKTLARARPLVVLIWLLIATAALLGLLTPL